MDKKILITQSNYIPWKGYFDGIAASDVFVVYDDMQFTRRDWRNRNVIKSSSGPKWLTIPVEVKGKFFQKINETKIVDRSWSKSHLDMIRSAYAGAAAFKTHFPLVEAWYREADFGYLTDVNQHFIRKINHFLGIKTPIILSSEFVLHEEKTQRLVNICKELNASEYYTGPAARAYMDETKFQDQNIKVTYFDYSGYREYPQVHGDFTHNVSIIDLILSVGDLSTDYMKFTV